MSIISTPFKLPLYQQVTDSVKTLGLNMSGSELHGIICGYLSTGANREGSAYLFSLISNPNDVALRPAILTLFEMYSISQQQIENMGFEFQLMLPDDEEPLLIRAQSFSEWCDGFAQGIRKSGIDYDQLQDSEALDALEAIEHITQFAEMDYNSIHFAEADEHALMEITEYARMAVLDIHSDIQLHFTDPDKSDSERTH